MPRKAKELIQLLQAKNLRPEIKTKEKQNHRHTFSAWLLKQRMSTRGNQQYINLKVMFLKEFPSDLQGSDEEFSPGHWKLLKGHLSKTNVNSDFFH